MTKPNSKNTSGTAPKQVGNPVVTDPMGAYIASSVEYPYYNQDRGLPQTIDEAEVRFGFGIYDKMANEPVLAAALKALKIMSLNDGLTIVPNKPQPEKDASPEDLTSFEQSQELADFARYCIDRLSSDKEAPISASLWNLLDAVHKGHKLAEVTFELLEDGPYKGKVGIESVRCKPRENYTIVVDAQNNFRGIMAKVPEVSLVLRIGIMGDASAYPNVIAPEKILMLTLDENDGNPQGRSWFRPAYDPYYRKALLKPEHLGAGKRFAGGMITATGPNNGESKTVGGTNGKPITVNEAINSTLAMLKNGGVGTFPYETQINVHDPKADGNFFQNAFDYADYEMLTAILLNARSLREAKHGSKADSESSQDVLAEVIAYIRVKLCELIRRLIRRLLLLNFDKGLVDEYCPEVVMQQSSEPDFAANMTAVGAGYLAKYITPSQKQEIDQKKLGIKPPTEAEMVVLQTAFETLNGAAEPEEADTEENTDTEEAATFAKGVRRSKRRLSFRASRQKHLQKATDRQTAQAGPAGHSRRFGR